MISLIGFIVAAPDAPSQPTLVVEFVDCSLGRPLRGLYGQASRGMRSNKTRLVHDLCGYRQGRQDCGTIGA